MKRNTIKHRPARTGLVALVAAIIGVATVAIGCRRFRRADGVTVDWVGYTQYATHA